MTSEAPSGRAYRCCSHPAHPPICLKPFPFFANQPMEEDGKEGFSLTSTFWFLKAKG